MLAERAGICTRVGGRCSYSNISLHDRYRLSRVVSLCLDLYLRLPLLIRMT